MGQTYYDSTLTDAQIQQVLDAINNILTPSNNGKVLAISGGTLEARSVQWGGGGGYPEPSGTILLTQNGIHDVKDYAEANVQVQGGSIEVIPLTATANAVYTAPTGKAYSPVTVNVSGGGDILSGNDAPSASLGNDGDIYKRSFPLPTNVNFVEYLQSSGSQYIDTGILPTSDVGLMFKGLGFGSTAWVLGTRDTTTIASANAALVVSFNGSTTAYCLKSFGVAHDLTACPVSNGGEYYCEIKVSELDGSKYASEVTTSGSSSAVRGDRITTAAANYPIVLFGVNTIGTITKANGPKICRAVFYDFGSPTNDYLPCLDGNGIACMWDNIAGEYVYNDGTGDFAYGNTVTPAALDPVYYVKKNGAWEVIHQ